MQDSFSLSSISSPDLDSAHIYDWRTSKLAASNAIRSFMPLWSLIIISRDKHSIDSMRAADSLSMLWLCCLRPSNTWSNSSKEIWVEFSKDCLFMLSVSSLLIWPRRRSNSFELVLVSSTTESNSVLNYFALSLSFSLYACILLTSLFKSYNRFCLPCRSNFLTFNSSSVFF